MPKYRVYISQVNQTYVEVSAKNEEDAREKGYRKWRKEDAHSNIMSVTEIPQEIKKKKHGRKNVEMCKTWPNCSCQKRGTALNCLVDTCCCG